MQEVWSGKEQKGVLILVDEGRGRIESVSIWKHAANTYRDKMPGEGQSWFAGRFNFVCMRNIDKYQGWGFPDGSVIKNPPANAGVMGSTPDLGRSTCLGATKPVHHNYWAMFQSLGAATTEAQGEHWSLWSARRGALQ